MTSEVSLSSTPTRPPAAAGTVPGARRAPSAGPAVDAAPPRRLPDVLVGLGAVAAALVVFSWRLSTPSPWRDEAVTIAVANRSAVDVWRLVQHVDLVHAPFYFLVHALPGPADVGDARWISVVAAALTAPLLFGLGRRLAAPAVGAGTARLTGAAAAALFVAMPFVSRYAQEARPYAVATLLATAATYLLVRAGTGHRRATWAAYALTLPLLVAFNTVAALVLVAHAGWLLAAPARVRRRGAAAAAAGLLAAAPLVLAQSRQSEQVAFLERPTLAELGSHVVFALGSSAVAVVVAALAVALALWRARARRLLLVGLLWGALPWPLLWALSQLQPFWTTRYLVFVAPGTCLLLAAVVTVALTRRHRAAVAGATAALLVAGLTVTGLHMQFVFRDPEIGHAEDLRGTARYVAEHARPGDGLLFVPDGEYRYRVLTQLYPQAFAALDDVALDEPAAASATLVGRTLPPERLAQAVAGLRRVWVVGGTGRVVTATAADRETVRLLDAGYQLVSTEERRAFSVRLYVAR
ncbi:hypothetical protein GTQ99_15905 [Kineococcus sp. T13]|uniref:hypothetical protein n=1 Tax=Kineococcus vitellinus TaxID=2696565 RepID=UPI0014128E69|nr:hypothetical protein [Kineococcus vitellinus]NAZ76893.1 hypothetical protein [Kineococcus vitellinus]